MASKEESDLSWFYDTEEIGNSPTKNFSAAETARRPWKAFWPPKSDNDVQVWTQSEYAEVLTWDFEPGQPFDQPWREWLKSSLVKSEIEECLTKYGSQPRNQMEFNDHDIQSIPRHDIDPQIEEMPKVWVNSVAHIAPLELYETQKPYFSQLPCETDLPRTNLITTDYPIEIREISGKEHLFKLDQTGFEFLQLPTRTSNWTDESVRSEYLPETSEWLKEYFQCKEVFIYNYNLRTNDMKETGKNGPWRSPIFKVHCDNTPESCAKRLEFQFPTEAEAIKKGRYRYIDIWRCLASEAEDVDSPLALCDYRSIAPEDLKRIDIIYPHFSEEGFEVAYNPRHQWFYKKGMAKDDVVVFKLDDNLPGVAPFAPHTAFIDPTASGKYKRASIEVRAIVIG